MTILLALLLMAAGWCYLLQRPEAAGRLLAAAAWAFALQLAWPIAWCLLSGVGAPALPDQPWGLLALGWASFAGWLVHRAVRARLKPSEARVERERVRGVERRRVAPREEA